MEISPSISGKITVKLTANEAGSVENPLFIAGFTYKNIVFFKLPGQFPRGYGSLRIRSVKVTLDNPPSVLLAASLDTWRIVQGNSKLSTVT